MSKPTRRPPVQKARPGRPGVHTVRALRREVARLTAELEAAEMRHRRQLAALRRASDRRMAVVVREIAALRHHEARAEALARVLAERDGALTGPGAASPPSGVSDESTSPPSR